MNKIKLVMVLIFPCLASSVLANTATDSFPDTKTNQFNEFKQRLLTRADNEIYMLQQFKACLNAAPDQAAAKICHTNKMDAMRTFHQDDKEHHDSMKQMHQKMMDKKSTTAAP